MASPASGPALTAAETSDISARPEKRALAAAIVWPMSRRAGGAELGDERGDLGLDLFGAEPLRQIAFEHRQLRGFLVDQVLATAGGELRRSSPCAASPACRRWRRPPRRRGRCARRPRAASGRRAGRGSSSRRGASLARIAVFMSSVMRSLRVMAVLGWRKSAGRAKRRSPHFAGFDADHAVRVSRASSAAACCARA